jgi:hypothetical protein
MARVSVPFTEGHYYGRGERPNTELADNSPSIEKIFCGLHVIYFNLIIFKCYLIFEKY